MSSWGPGFPPSDTDSLVPWLFLVLLLGGFIWATHSYRIPCTLAANTLTNAAAELEKRASNTDGQTAALAGRSEQAETDGQQSTEDASPQESQENSDPGLGPEDPHRCPPALAEVEPFPSLWKRFSEAWRATHRNSRGQNVGTVSAADFFTTESVLERTEGAIPDALPGVFTAVGLLGTFVGIAIGLAGIPDGTSGGAPSAEDLSQSINTLMGGMSTAFSTSIVGITGSIWWLFEFRWARKGLASGLTEFVNVADRLFPFEQPHETLLRIATSNTKAAEGLGTLKGIQKDSSAVLCALEPLTKDVASVKGGIQTLGQDMAGALEPLIERHIKEPIQNLNLNLGERQTQALGQMVSEFRDTLVSHVGEELHRFGEALKTARAHQSSTVAEMEAFFLLLESVSETQLKVLDRGASVAATFEQGLFALTESQQAIEQAGSAAGRIMKEAEDLVGESRRQVNAQKEATEALLASWTQEKDKLKDLREHLLALTSELGEKILEFRGLAAEKIGEVFHSFDSEMGKVVDHLGGTLAELRETTEEFPGIAIRLVDVTNDLTKTSRTQHESLTRGLKAFEKGSGEIVERLNAGHAELARASKALPVSAQEISDGIGGFVDSIKDARAGFEESANGTIKAAGTASGRLESAVSTIESVRASVDELNRALRNLSQRLPGQVEQAPATDVSTSSRRAVSNEPGTNLEEGDLPKDVDDTPDDLSMGDRMRKLLGKMPFPRRRNQ